VMPWWRGGRGAGADRRQSAAAAEWLGVVVEQRRPLSSSELQAAMAEPLAITTLISLFTAFQAAAR